MVERDLAKVEAVGSSPIYRSMIIIEWKSTGERFILDCMTAGDAEIEPLDLEIEEIDSLERMQEDDNDY